MVELLETGPNDGRPTLLLAHGAGAPMDSEWMNTIAEHIAAHGVRIVRFEFSYMHKRRIDGKKRGPGRADKLQGEFHAALDALGPTCVPFIGGKSMGGRVASMIVDARPSRGLVCLGYPFHAPGKPDQPRTAHLEHLQSRALFMQGTRDSFGSRAEVASYMLSQSIQIEWLEDGDHSFKPRKKSGHTLAQHMDRAGRAVADFCNVS